jgi:hypothetical protein
MTEEGSLEALTAGGAMLQARKQIAASRDGLDAGLMSASNDVFLGGAQTCKSTAHRNRTGMTRR